MVDYAKTQLGIPIEKASLLATIHGSSQVIGVLTLLPLSDYLGRKKTIVIMNSLIAAALFGLCFQGTPGECFVSWWVFLPSSTAPPSPSTALVQEITFPEVSWER